jgi:ADP-ribosylglycohydrolase
MFGNNLAVAKLGAVVGAMCGDAAGATLEFFKGQITAAMAKRAMTMPGGGILNVAPGQVTDDSELMLGLGAVLKASVTGSSGPVDFPVDNIAVAYLDWFKSNPFDIGMATRAATSSLSTACSNGSSPSAIMMAAAKQYNSASEANGALMRCMPIPCFYSHCSYEQIAECAKVSIVW